MGYGIYPFIEEERGLVCGLLYTLRSKARSREVEEQQQEEEEEGEEGDRKASGMMMMAEEEEAVETPHIHNSICIYI